MSDDPDFTWPLDFGRGVHGEWHGDALWIERADGPGAFFARIETGPEERAAPPVWKVHRRDPLTITPSIKVSDSHGVKAHGFIRAGRWEPCPDDRG